MVPRGESLANMQLSFNWEQGPQDPCWAQGATAWALTLAALFALAVTPPALRAQEKPYFVTYDHHMEEPGDLEVAFSPVVGVPKTARTFTGSTLEIGYGAKGWWTTELYLDGQTTRGDSTIFTGYRWENRFRPLLREHWINPVLYVEFDNLNGADKSLK